MRTGRAGPHLFTSSDEDSEEDAPEGRRARVSDPWLAPVHATVERDLVRRQGTSETLGPNIEGSTVLGEVHAFRVEVVHLTFYLVYSFLRHWLASITGINVPPPTHKLPRNTFASPQAALHQSVASPNRGTELELDGRDCQMST